MKEVSVVKIFDAQTVVKALTATSGVIDLNTYKPDGDFSLQIAVSGDGTASIAYQCSNDGVNYFAPEGSSALFANWTKTSGTTGGGIDGFTPELGRYIRFVVTETGTSANVVISAWLAMR